MPRDHARVPHSLWEPGSRFLELTEAQQRLYMFASSQPEVSYAGVVPYTPRRWAGMAKNCTAVAMRRNVEAVHAAGYVAADEENEEILLRRFVETEGILTQPNVAKATRKAFNAIHSPALRRVFLDDLLRLARGPQRPGWEKGWKVLADLLPEEAIPEGLPEPFGEGFREGSDEGSPEGIGEGIGEGFAEGCSRDQRARDNHLPPDTYHLAPEPCPPAAAARAAAQAAAKRGRKATAAAGIDNGAGLPGEVARLRSKLDVARLFVRWDGLTKTDLAEVVQLVAVHGDGPLVKAALHAYRPDDPPVFAQAWLPSWRALPPPGELRLAAHRPKCPLHLREEPCGGCAADAKAGQA
jgi:hypothetical protein